MFNRENAVGIVLVAVCAVVAGVMLWAIGTGRQIRLDAPGYIALPLTLLFIGLVLFGLFRNLRGPGPGRGRAWPHPQSGTRSLWDRIRGRRD